MTDAHLWTAGAYYIIGIVLIVMAFTVWWTHPINRVWIFGRYLTPDGMRLVMMSWPMVALFGAFIFSCALDHHTHWLHMNGPPVSHRTLTFFATVEAVISWITALTIIYLGGRTLIGRVWKR